MGNLTIRKDHFVLWMLLFYDNELCHKIHDIIKIILVCSKTKKQLILYVDIIRLFIYVISCAIKNIKILFFIVRIVWFLDYFR